MSSSKASDSPGPASKSGQDDKIHQKNIEELSTKLLQLEQQFVKKGLSAKLVNSELLQHIRDKKTQKKLMKRNTLWNKRVLLISTAVVVAALAVVTFIYQKDLYDYVKSERCLVDTNIFVAEMSRPLQPCSTCKGLKQVPVVKDIDRDTFVEKYAYSAVPVLIKDATKNWTAMETFSYDYFQKIYSEKEGAFDVIEEQCQFFGYKTEFDSLEEALTMNKDRAAYKPGEKPWYFGWSNCHDEIGKELRSHYQRPYFLPNESESSNTDWIFMGGPGPGAFIHLDFVQRPSWQAQISGTKSWTLIPSPECEDVCHQLNVTVEKGDIFVVDTNQWYHSTYIHPGPLSITIGSEYD